MATNTLGWRLGAIASPLTALRPVRENPSQAGAVANDQHLFNVIAIEFLSWAVSQPPPSLRQAPNETANEPPQASRHEHPPHDTHLKLCKAAIELDKAAIELDKARIES